jgi:anti-anti-sigma regulatory factor
MSQKFQASVHQREDVSYVKLAGVIDEDNELGPMADRLVGPTAVINLGEIERINSCGVRDWVNWLGRVEKSGSRVVLVECSPAIVAQINLVNNFTGAGVVKSFFAPYYCPNCDLEKVLLCEARDFYDQSKFKSPTCRCDECDGVMDFDDMEESYFAFLGGAKRLPADARIDAVIEEFTPTDGERKLRGRSNPSLPPATPSPVTGAGSLPSVPSLPSITRTPSSLGSAPSSNPGLYSSSQRWPLLSPEDLSRRVVPPPPQGRSAGAWILVGVLVATALALLAYVFFAAPGRAGASSHAASASEAGH